jgi:uncharacterized LabA/DUF88 family protein
MPDAGNLPKVLVFIDYWNLQLSLNDREARLAGGADRRFSIDWMKLPQWLADQGAAVSGFPAHTYGGARVYTSFNPMSQSDLGYKKWVSTWLDRQPGIQVFCKERRPKAVAKCPKCHKQIEICPHCSEKIVASVEKGVDTAIATDMIRLAWENAYDVAVLVTSDADLVPAAEFLDQKGKRVIQAGFPPLGVDLATSCWASFDIFARRADFRRT